MNCGRDEDPLEMFTRSALAMKSKPTVIYVLSGTPFWTTADCEKKSIENGKRTAPLSKDENGMLRVMRRKHGLLMLTNSSTAMHAMTFLYKTATSKDGIPSLYADTTPMAQVILLIFI